MSDIHRVSRASGSSATSQRRAASAPGEIVCRLSYFGEDGQEFAVVAAGEPVVMGRSPGCDLVLGDESVSRRHARVERDGGAWVIQDLESKNGVKVNTYRTVRQTLCHGDRIDLGAVRLYVEIRPAAAATEARVVFEKDDRGERSLRTEIIEMDRLGSLLAGLTDPPQLPSAANPLVPVELTPSGESVGLLPLFGEAAEALLSCDTLDETLERILALVFDNLPAERGVICLYDEASNETTPKVMRTAAGVPDEPISISGNITRHAIERKQSVLVQDTLLDERFGGADSVIMMNIQSAMCAPLYHEGRVVGFIYVDRQSSQTPFTGPHLQALSTLALLSAVAVEQAALRDRLRQAQEVRARLSRYSSPAVVERIIAQSELAERGMAAEESEVTVLFADLTGFTPLAERLAPAEVVQLLNSIFERLTEVIFEFEGTLDKFRGDGLMAVFGAPLPQHDHAERAVHAALRMQELMADHNTFAPPDRRIDMRVGINSGPVIAGDIGSPQRKDYTVIGDTVNTASRLESSVARPGQVVIGPATFDQLGPGFQCEPLEETALKGKRHMVRPYLVLGLSGGPGAG